MCTSILSGTSIITKYCEIEQPRFWYNELMNSLFLSHRHDRRRENSDN